MRRSLRCHAVVAEPRISLRQQAGQAFGPGLLACLLGDQVLADFKFHMGQAAAFAMDGNGIVAGIAHGIGLVIAHHQIALGLEQRLHDMGEARVAVIEHAHMPGPLEAFEYRREAVHGDQHGGPTLGLACIQCCDDAPVIGPEDFIGPCLAFGRAQIPLPGISVDSLTVTMEVSTAGSRLQSITSRE